ncbi:hypothetical protein Arub01_35170 [Actinomadura rubrobrunea]|uniref:Uncharacterized protein n=1 Tax=Actinomadura rubrobrunea TaxID=115335 RepID=A0A9W6PYL6_9ACTN|nr:hypothetical protein Arub01_35170 [Actinomadura rubrobrunea]
MLHGDDKAAPPPALRASAAPPRSLPPAVHSWTTYAHAATGTHGTRPARWPRTAKAMTVLRPRTEPAPDVVHPPDWRDTVQRQHGPGLCIRECPG